MDLCEFKAKLGNTEQPRLKKTFFKDLFYLFEYTVAVFTHTRRGHKILLQMVVSHHVHAVH